MMKHYLDLAARSDRVHRRQSRMTRLCIVLAVFLVAVMFGLADMYLQGMVIETRRQTARFVRREALQWCVTAIPVGLGLSVLVVWALCAVMRHFSSVWFGSRCSASVG